MLSEPLDGCSTFGNTFQCMDHILWATMANLLKNKLVSPNLYKTTVNLGLENTKNKSLFFPFLEEKKGVFMAPIPTNPNPNPK